MNAWYRTTAVLLLLVSGLVLQQSVQVLRIHEDGQPGSGFMPFGLGLALAALSLALLVKHRRRDAERRPFWERRAWLHPLLAVALTAGFIVVFDDVGAITSVAVLVTCWLWLVSRKSLPISALTGVLTAAAVHVIFERFLQTPFPRGLLF
ncbi:MAG: tripartite tricarboxylate transporter TctB family protein [Deltaproteobacteria bacterium]|nr:tripartite tricarboxylate transporter TctB family protein [Deltaproteobacteria bacterium]